MSLPSKEVKHITRLLGVGEDIITSIETDTKPFVEVSGADGSVTLIVGSQVITLYPGQNTLLDRESGMVWNVKVEQGTTI